MTALLRKGNTLSKELLQRGMLRRFNRIGYLLCLAKKQAASAAWIV
ncbi:hypothetical protein HMPREF0758_0837 [Serratia odorifera DSM 4582]|jgi:hypothetical protein|uniref:Uncharacterized protein n=1 Tax=Serratia odorifera DSM 4582 TaxID=667129 RepID=D4DY54_SEROD|nr:hypothetical protein HMPREF0758_0837 [Serratia odorifera DSM 4582]